jgi:hypothetical protein
MSREPYDSDVTNVEWLLLENPSSLQKSMGDATAR